MLTIRPLASGDDGAIWSIIGPCIRAGETCTLLREMTAMDGLRYWTGSDRETFVAEEDGNILGTY
jgi:hypothetical protein